MSRIKIVIDSTAGYSLADAEKLGLHTVPLNIMINDEIYRDGIDLTLLQFLDKMEQAPELPKSSQPAVGSFLEIFNQLGEDGSEVLCIALSGNLSGTYQSAVMAGEQSSTKVTVVDSKGVACGIDFLVRKAQEMIARNCSVTEIVTELEKIRDHTKYLIALNTVENLVKGGRLSKGKAMISTLLNIKPIVSINDGLIEPFSKARSFNLAIKSMVNQLKEDMKTMEIVEIGLAQVGNPEVAEELKNQILTFTNLKNIEIVEASPVLGTHTARGTVGLIYYVKTA